MDRMLCHEADAVIVPGMHDNCAIVNISHIEVTFCRNCSGEREVLHWIGPTKPGRIDGTLHVRAEAS